MTDKPNRHKKNEPAGKQNHSLPKGSKKLPSPHDTLFKVIYSQPELAYELFQLVLSPKELKAFRRDTLKVEKDTFKGRQADLILSARLKGENSRIFLFFLLEHKAYYDKNLFNQLLDYQIAIRKKNLEDFGRAMPVVPILFYHGRRPLKWRRSLQEADFGENLSKIPVKMRRSMINYHLYIIDLHDERIKREIKRRKLVTKGILVLLSEIWSLKPTSSRLREIFVRCGALIKRNEERVLDIVEYLKSTVGLSAETWDKVEVELKREGLLKRGGYMNTREVIREKGRIEGRKEGIQQGMQQGMQQGIQRGMETVALNMLKKDFDISSISEVTSLSEKEIRRIIKSRNGVDPV